MKEIEDWALCWDFVQDLVVGGERRRGKRPWKTRKGRGPHGCWSLEKWLKIRWGRGRGFMSSAK